MADQMIQPAPTGRGPLAQGLRAHIELADPVTWITPMTMVVCGALAAGRGEPGFHLGEARDLLLAALAVLMCGPLGTGFSQSINDYFDRDLDAINDPSRPIPSGRIGLGAARLNWLALGAATLGAGLALAGQSVWVPALAAVGLALAVAYSVPPVKLKQHYWFGPPAVGFGYVFLSWSVGHLLFAPLTWPSLSLALINSAMAASLLFLNDIKSLEGDRRLGLQSMTVALGERRTMIISFTIIGLCELLLLTLALATGRWWAAGFVALAIVVPLGSQRRLYREPTHRNFQRYMLASNPFVLLIQILSALIVGGYVG